MTTGVISLPYPARSGSKRESLRKGGGGLRGARLASAGLRLPVVAMSSAALSPSRYGARNGVSAASSTAPRGCEEAGDAHAESEVRAAGVVVAARLVGRGRRLGGGRPQRELGQPGHTVQGDNSRALAEALSELLAGVA
jgi:hypothetical protein